MPRQGYMSGRSDTIGVWKIFSRSKTRLPERSLAQIGPAIADVERQRALRKPPESLGAWEAYQRGLFHVSMHDALENETARRFFQRALDLDPGFAAAYSAMALTYSMNAATFFTMDYNEACALAQQSARKAVALDGSDADAACAAWAGIPCER